MKKILLLIGVLLFTELNAQNLTWQALTDSIPTLSSPRVCDLNGDGIKDVVMGGGTDGVFSNYGIMAFNGANGNLLWKRSARNEVFGSAIFQDITNDGIQDVFIAGRQAQLLAINGSNGQLIWDYFPYNSNPADSGLYNFYNPQFISDVNNDGKNDLLVANGGDHAAPDWETDRPPGHLMVISGSDGHLIAKAVVPDSAETYCSPLVADIQNNGNKWILYGTGGENLGGSFWACPLNELLINQSLSNSVELISSANKGFIAPASMHKTNSGTYDVIIQGFDGRVTKINGSNWSTSWSFMIPNTESSAAAVIGNFAGGDQTPDVYLSLFKGISPSYSDFYQVMLNGETGSLVFKDSLGKMGYASGNAVDMNNDGRDEAISSLTYLENGVYKNKIQVIDFQNGQISQLGNTYTGVNLGSTPYFGNLDTDPEIELVFSTKKDSLNPVGWKGIYVRRIDLSNVLPNAGIAWGSYLGTDNDGIYNLDVSNCGSGSVITNSSVTQPSCNGFANGSIALSVISADGPHTYLWSTENNNSSITNLAAGSYSVTVTNALDCFETRTFTLSDPYTISFGGIAAPTCPGGNNGVATVNSSGCPCMTSPCTFLWENGVTTKPNNALASGWRSIVITHPGGCVVTDSVLIPEPIPIITDTLIAQNTCFGYNLGSIDLISSDFQPVIYNWSNGDSTQFIDSLAAGNYTAIVSDVRGCIDTLTFEITQPSEIQFNTQVSGILCHGDSTGSIEIQAQGGNGIYTYWINQLVATSLNSNLSAGVYAVYVSDSHNCSSVTTNITVGEPQAISTTMNSTPQLTSLDGTASVSVTGGTSPYSYSWNDVNNQSESMAVYLNSGWYTVEILDANGCQFVDSVFVETKTGLDQSAFESISIYPNPTSEILNLSLIVDKAEIIDLQGKVIKVIKNSSQVDVKSLSVGNYMLKVENKETISIYRFIKK